MKHKENTVLFLLLAVIMLFLGTSAAITYAYLSDSVQSLQNVITTGTIQIELLERKWDSKENGRVQPGAVINKNPSILNSGKNAAHAFLEIRIPMKRIAVVDENQRRSERKMRELFLFEADGAGWNLIKNYQDGQQMVYIYGYDRILYPQEETTELFTAVEIVNYLEGELKADEVLEIEVQAKAIQTGVETVGSNPEEIYEIMLTQMESGL